MSAITITKTAEDGASKALRVTVPVERVREAEDKAVRQYAKRARLPGFRPGHAPEAVVRRRFSQEIRQWVLEEVIREGWEQAKSAESLEPVAEPSVRNLKFEAGQPGEFELLVHVRPELTLGRVGGFTLSRTVAAVTEQEVTEQVGRLREQRAAWLPVEGARPAPGQMVRGEVAPIEDGVVKEAQPYTLLLGDGQAIPAGEEKIMTLLPGETVDAEVRYPDDHAEAERRGKTRAAGRSGESRRGAVAQVRRELVLAAVAEREGLRATEAELDQRIARIAEQRGTSPAKVYASLEENKRLAELERAITEEKVFGFLLSQSTVTEARS